MKSEAAEVCGSFVSDAHHWSNLRLMTTFDAAIARNEILMKAKDRSKCRRCIQRRRWRHVTREGGATARQRPAERDQVPPRSIGHFEPMEQEHTMHKRLNRRIGHEL